MTIKRRSSIEDMLRRGGAIHRLNGNYSLCHPSGNLKLEEEEVFELLDEGSLVVVNCGCTGFWWALRPDLMAMRSARIALEAAA